MGITIQSVPYVVVSVFYFVYFIPFIALFLARRHLEPINSRGWPLAVFSSVAGFLFFNVVALETFVTNDHLTVSCHFLYWPTCTFVGLFAIPYFLRSAMLYTQYKFNQCKLGDSPKLTNVWMRRNKRVSSPAVQFIILAVVFAISMIIAACIQFAPGVYFPPNTNAHCLDRAIFILIPQVAVVVLIYVVMVVLTWGIRDAFGIKTELKVLTIIIPLLFVPCAIRTATDLLPSYIDGSFFTLPIIGVSFTVTIVFPVFMSLRLARRRHFHKVSLPASEDELRDITGNLAALFRLTMDNEVLRHEFLQFCVDSWCVENFLFYQDVTEYERLEGTGAREERARRILGLYFGEDAPRQVNVDMKAELAVRAGVAAGVFDPELFHEPLAQVETQMKQDTLSHWRQTSSFRAALQKLRGSASVLSSFRCPTEPTVLEPQAMGIQEP